MNLYLQSPIHSNDERDVISGKTHRGQDNHHGNESSLRDSSCTDTGCSRCDAGGTGRGAECIQFANGQEHFCYKTVFCIHFLKRKRKQM